MEDFGFFMWKACMNSTAIGEWPQNSHTHSSIIHCSISSKHMAREKEICKMKTLEGQRDGTYVADVLKLEPRG
jgi:hypothetical protein